MSILRCSTPDIDLPSSDGTVPENLDLSPPSWFLCASISGLVSDFVVVKKINFVK